MVTRPVLSMATNAVGLKRGTSVAGAAGRGAAWLRGNIRMPTTRPPIAATPPMKPLRLTFSRIARMSCLLRSGFDCSANPLIRAAPADVAGHRVVDVLIARFRVLREQAGGLHDLTALAVAALRDRQALPGRLHLAADGCAADGFNGGDRLAGCGRDRGDARARRHAVEMHRARSAKRHPTSEFRAGEAEFIPQRPQEGRLRRHVHRHRLAVDIQSWHRDLQLLKSRTHVHDGVSVQVYNYELVTRCETCVTFEMMNRNR